MISNIGNVEKPEDERAGRPRRRVPPRRPRAAPGDEGGFGLVEILIATTIAAIGLISVAGLQLAVAAQARIAAWNTGQALAVQEVFERMNEAGYAAAAAGTDSVIVDGYTYRVNVTVTTPIVRVKEVRATVGGVGSIAPRTFVTRIHDRRSVPVAP